MINFKHLNNEEIYPLLISENNYLVYAPLAGWLSLNSFEEVELMERCLQGESVDKKAEERLRQIMSKRPKSKSTPKKTHVGQIHKLTILPNYKCNFKCSYCYSVEGRQNKEISEAMALGVINHFIDRKRTNLEHLWLAILGGGEPFLSPKLTEKLICHARLRAEEQNFDLGIGLTTNGSIYDKNLSDAMIVNHVSLGVSFEVLKDIQNKQRQGYDKVVPVVKQYMEDGVDITIKSIITPANVGHLEEMVLELKRLFPLVKRYKLQIVEDASMFANVQVMRKFYADFTEHFFYAEEIGKNNGIDVYVLASKFIDMLIEHYCGGEMCLNPEGTITICHRISSPKEKEYKHFVYGNVTEDGNIIIDNKKFLQLISHNVDAGKQCKSCFVKWHCGGGCLAQSTIYSQQQLDIICNWTRDFTKQILQRRFVKNQEGGILQW